MNKRLLMSVATAALISATGFAHAQGMSRDASPGGAAAQSAPSRAPSADRAAPMERSAPTSRDEATDTSKRPDAGSDMKATQSDDKIQRDNGKQRATDSTRDNQKPAASQASDGKAGKDMKAEGNNAAGRSAAEKSASDNRPGTTTGQAGAGAKLSTEQRTKITTTIKQQNIKPVTNINFSISVGTRVPRDVGFHPLPAEIVTVYPDWRGYEFFLVNSEIIVVNPRTLEIVAVLDV